MTYAIVGASSGVGRALALAFARAGHDLVIVSSGQRDIAAMASDLAIRHGRRVLPVAADITDLDTYLPALHQAIDTLGGIDGLLLPVGAVLDDDDVGLGVTAAEWTLRVNFSAVAATALSLLPGLRLRPGATIVGFGSISGSRGRNRNIMYAAAKRALASFFESLRHACAPTTVVVQFYVLGYVDSAMTYGRKTPLRPASPDTLSARVLRDIRRDVGVVYYPGVWRWLTAGLAWLPWRLYKRLSF